jgi:hypothetical protein
MNKFSNSSNSNKDKEGVDKISLIIIKEDKKIIEHKHRKV